MGRDVTGIRIDKKPNVKSNGATPNKVRGSPKISNGKAEREEKVVGGRDAKKAVNEVSPEKQDVLTVKSTNSKAGSPEGKTKAQLLKAAEKKLSSPVKPSLETDANGDSQPSLHSLQPSAVSTANGVPTMLIADKVEMTNAAISPSKTNEMHTPVTVRRSQPHSMLMSGKHLQADSKKYYDEEDTCSLAASVATSVGTVRSKVTVPMGPTFKSAERLARRKEFYTKLEEKHKALEAEKHEYVARSKEEEEAAIKQLRKAMTYRANPVPNFYREGPPPKVELKKLPVTRAKSPNFTRRKSCGDAVKSSADEKKSAARPTRHSIGVHKNGIASPSTPNNKDLSSTRTVKQPTKLKDSNGSSKTKARPKQVKETAVIPKQVKETAVIPQQVKETAVILNSESEHMSHDIPVTVETMACHANEQRSDFSVLEDEMKIAEAAIIEFVITNS